MNSSPKQIPIVNLADLKPEALMAAAVAETGFDDFGPDDFLEPLRVLTEGAIAQVPFHPMGLIGFKLDLHRMLVNRLRFQADLRKHPEILEEDVGDPIIVLGLVRTGTSKLQRMMSAAPDVQKLYFWRLLNPAPFAGADSSVPDPRIGVAEQATTMLGQLSPEFMAAHPTVAGEVDEELLLQQFSFATIVHYFLTPTRRYYDWIKGRPLPLTYRYMRQMIQYLQWQDGGKRGRPWIMKSPLHLGQLDSLMREFPRATLVHCHRDVTDVMASFCRLNEAGWRLKTDVVDLDEAGRSLLEVWSGEMDRYLDLRRALEPGLNVIDVAYRQIADDPMTVIRALYRRAGRVLHPDCVSAMQIWEQNNPKDRYGKNEYTIGRYGLSREQVEAAFKNYLDRFGVYTSAEAPRVE